jgi:Protein of unknown function (DUF2868)
MHQRALRTVLLIQAIEETDRTGEVIPLADRAEASRAAVREAAAPPGAQSGAALSRATQRFLVQRAGYLLERLRTRSPAVMHILAVAGGFTWLGRLVLVLALAAGISLSALDGSRRINILAFPLIGLLAWNLFVYVMLLVGWIRTLKTHAAPLGFWLAHAYERWIGSRIEALMRHSTRYNVPLTSGLRRFAVQWAGLSQPLLLLQAKRLLHLGAAFVAIGLITGLYVRGIVLRYEAGWESTFLGPESAHKLVALLYGPAAAVSGISYGSVDDLRALRWTATGGGGEAASWIHLIALTAGMYIVAPRLLAALASMLGIWRFSRKPPVPASLLGYARALAMGVGSGTGSDIASVIPYAYEPRAESVAGLESLLAAALGGNLKVQIAAPVHYGDERTVAQDQTEKTGAWYVLLMTLASTPEAENHGAFISGWRDWLLKQASSAPLLILIDEGPYAARMRGDAAFEQRVQERRRLWQEFVAGYGLHACFADLIQTRPGGAAEINARESARAALWIASEHA